MRVHIRYPEDGQADDEAWVAAIAARHDGDLADERMLSAPMQRIAQFPTVSSAQAFVDELTVSARWRAHIIQ